MGFRICLWETLGRIASIATMGDGTFSDVTENIGTDKDQWTTSCLLCDLDGDSLPDLYVVNYLEGADVYGRICRDSKNQPRMCRPSGPSKAVKIDSI